MESVIRDGALRLLTAETSCDVILSCQGHRLMAHKLILSMVSPVFRGLLLEDCSDPTVIILPDINGSIMSLILDYIYTGSVVVYSNTIHDFIGVASLLKIHLDIEYSEGFLPNRKKVFHKSGGSEKYQYDEDLVKKSEDVHYQEKVESLDVVSAGNAEVYSKKNQRKLPSLLPINKLQTREKIRSQRKLCSYVLPSPWCPRIERVFGDPRNDRLETYENQISPPIQTPSLDENDSNNNFKYQSVHTVLNYHTANKLNEVISNIYQNIPDKTLKTSKNSTYDIFSFESQVVKKLNSTDSVSKSVSRKKIKSDGCQNTKENSPVSTPTYNLQPQLETLPKNIEIKDVSEDESLTIKSITNDSIKDSIRDSDSNHSSSIDEEIGKSGEESKFDSKGDKPKPFKCDDCGKCFSQLRNYKYHRSIHEGTKEFAAKCPECGKVFNDKGYLSSHMKIHRDKKEYACPHCPKRFNQRVAYNMHLRIHTGIKPHECSVCGKSFSRKMLLKQHQRVHTGERPYSCPECGKTFADRSNMSLHARLHTGVKPYSCNLCPKSFTKKHHLKTHMNFHTGLKPYNCEKCGLAFSQSSNMRTHYKKCILKNVSDSAASDGQRDSS